MKNIFVIYLIIKLALGCFINLMKYLFNYLTYEQMIKLDLLYLGNQNIIFLKLFQWLFINNSNIYFNQNIIDFVNTFTNNAPYSNDDIDWITISELFNMIQNENGKLTIDSFVPINSGTISLVFKGQYNNNIVAIKILRKNIKNKLIENIEIFDKILSIISKLNLFNTYKIYELFNCNKNDFILQTDFTNELNNILNFKKTFAKNKIIFIPNAYENITNKLKNVILLDWIDGYTINQLDHDDKMMICPIYLRFILSSYIIKGFIHADLHQGNIIFIKNIYDDKIMWKIGLIDFGSIIVANVEQINFMSMFLACIFEQKFIQFTSYLNSNKNNIFESYSDDALINSFNLSTKLYNDGALFNFNNSTNIHTDVVKFIDIFNINNCYFKQQIYKLILTILPQIYIYKKICTNTNHKNIISDYNNKLFAKFA